MPIKAGLELPELAKKHEHPASGYAAFRWPEFIAFADRLGVDLSAPIKRLVIDMEEDKVSILMDQQGSDALPEAKLVDTTTFHNKKYRTKKFLDRPGTDQTVN